MFVEIRELEKDKFSWKCKGGKKVKRPYKKQSASVNICDTHAVVVVDGTDEDYEMAKKVMREAARKYNHLSKKEMSYEVKLINHG